MHVSEAKMRPGEGFSLGPPPHPARTFVLATLSRKGRGKKIARGPQNDNDGVWPHTAFK